MKLLNIAAVAALTACGGIFAGATNAAPAAGLSTGAPAVRTLATPDPATFVEKTYYYRRRYWHRRPYWRRYHYWNPYYSRYHRRHYWHPYRRYYGRHYYGRPYYRPFYHPYRHPYYW